MPLSNLALHLAHHEPRAIRAARERLGWTQQELAGAANVPAPVIAAYESGGAIDPVLLDQVRAALEDLGFGFPFELSGGTARPVGITYSPRDRSETN